MIMRALHVSKAGGSQSELRKKKTSYHFMSLRSPYPRAAQFNTMSTIYIAS